MVDGVRLKQNMSRAAGLLAGLLIFTSISHRLDEMFVDTHGINWCRILWHQYYEDAGKIDNLYLGSSHVYCDLDPVVLDRLTGKYNFNLASPKQLLNGSYYLLREADRDNKLQRVYLEMYYGCSFDDKSLSAYQKNWQNTDYMKPSLNKAAYMAAIGGTDQYVNILLPFSRYRTCLGDWDYIKRQMEEKAEVNYQNCQSESFCQDGNGRESFEKQGYRRSTRIYQDSNKIFYQEYILSGYSVGTRNREYCRKIIEYCQKRGIQITMFVSPIYHLQLISTQDYDDYVEEIRMMAAEYEVPFYDFNLVREEYLALQDGKYFRDAGHLNENGGKLFTPFFYQVVSGKEEDNEKYFYESYQEKLCDIEPAVYGIYYKDPEEEDDRERQMRTMWVASNRDTGMEYRIILTPEDGERYTAQDFSENKEFQVPADERGNCTITARMKGGQDEVQTMEIHY